MLAPAKQPLTLYVWVTNSNTSYKGTNERWDNLPRVTSDWKFLLPGHPFTFIAVSCGPPYGRKTCFGWRIRQVCLVGSGGRNNRQARSVLEQRQILFDQRAVRLSSQSTVHVHVRRGAYTLSPSIFEFCMLCLVLVKVSETTAVD